MLRSVLIAQFFVSKSLSGDYLYRPSAIANNNCLPGQQVRAAGADFSAPHSVSSPLISSLVRGFSLGQDRRREGDPLTATTTMVGFRFGHRLGNDNTINLHRHLGHYYIMA